MADTIESKGADYANEDKLSNFKLVGLICGLPTRIVILVLIAIKVVRLGNLMASGKKPNNESISDSLLDLSNYAFLEDCALYEDELKELF